MKETEIKVMNDDETRDFCIRKDYEIFKKDKEIERLNNIINELENILKRDIKACNNKFENMFDRNYRRLILEEKYKFGKYLPKEK